ncbi:MAG: L-carnitine dehydratase/bile acid-inducible protein [Caulobacteraceae bacterium]|nr:L-carnitine dehydratase/bile acid-inducible protein [Caulobacteraceae bacterium]
MTPAAARGALEGVRVAEFGAGAALAYCGKLFADLGAHVVKVEPPGGDPGRREPPLVDIGDGLLESGVFAWRNTNKKSVIAAAEDADRLREIAGASDVLLDARPGAGADPGPTGHGALRAAFPALVIVAISWFGEDGPYRDFVGSDTVVRALAGVLGTVGPEERPLFLAEHQAGFPAALAGFTAALSALIGGGPRGRRFEISLQEANVPLVDYQMSVAASFPEADRRWGLNRFFPVFPVGIYPCREGWLGVTAFSPDQWRHFCAMLGLEAEAERPEYQILSDRFLRAQALEALFAPRLLQRTAHEWFEETQRRRLPIVVVPDMAELLTEPVHRSRGAFGEVRLGAARFQAPVLPQRLTATPPLAVGRAPLAGEHDGTWRAPPASVRLEPGPGADAGLPLAGVRIVDLAMGWAGTLATRQLADLGAEVIKVEGRAYPDWWRGSDYSEAANAVHQHELALNFNFLNRNKTGITLDLTRPQGADLLRRLVRTADAVVENYACGVLAKLGLDYARLVKEKPDLVMVSMPAFGATTPWAEVRAYGSTLEHGSGLPSITGRPDDPPIMNHIAYGDPIGGLNACPAVLAGVLHQRRTGEGQFIDLSQVECLFPLVAPWIIEQSISGSVAPRQGNRHPWLVPHGCFRCAGEDAWVVVAVTGDEAWPALARTVGRPDLAAEPSLASVEGRRGREDELEAAIEAWTVGRSPDEAMAALQARGVAAGAVRGLRETMETEPQLTARGFWQRIDRPFLGPHLQASPVFREEGRPYAIRTPAPTLGQSTREVLGRLLGLTAEELNRLEAACIIGEAPIPMSERAPRSAALLREAAKAPAAQLGG